MAVARVAVERVEVEKVEDSAAATAAATEAVVRVAVTVAAAMAMAVMAAAKAVETAETMAKVEVRGGAVPEERSAGTRQHNSPDTSTEAKPSVLSHNQKPRANGGTKRQPMLSSGRCPGT